MATSIAAGLNAFLLYRGLRKKNIYQPSPGWLIWYSRLFVACSAMVVTLWMLSQPISLWHDWSITQRVIQLFIEIFAAMGAYLATLYILGLRVSHLRHSV